MRPAVTYLALFASACVVLLITAEEPQCSTGVLGRVDCYPEGGGTEDLCKTRACCWEDGGAPEVEQEGPPRCFFPSHYGYEAVNAPLKEANTWKATLRRIESPTLFGGDVETLAVHIEEQTPRRLRIKIFDPNNDRFEVPYIKIKGTPNHYSKKTLYDVEFVQSPFGIKVSRKSTGQIVFDSTVGPLIFADQFLQLSTRIGSSDLYGLGEHLHMSFKHELNWRTLSIHAAGKHPVGPEARNMYGVHPMYLNMENDGKANALLFLNQHAMDVVLQPEPAVTFRTIGGILDFYIFLSDEDSGEATCTREKCDTEKDKIHRSTATVNVIEEYQQAIGLPAMPPYWALGFQLCRWEYEGSEHLKKVIQRTRDAGIPYDVQWGDVDYMISAQSFTIDTDKYPDLPEIVADLHKNGQKYVAIHDPGIKMSARGEYEAYDDGCDRDLWIKHNDGEVLQGEVWPGICVFADYTKDDTVKWWVEHAVKFHKKLPFDGFWIDMNEPSNFIYGSTKGCENNTWNHPPYMPKITGGLLWDRTLCMDAQQHLGRHYDLHSLYGHSMINATWQATRAIFKKKRSLIVSRSSFVGSGHFAGKWLGDNRSSFKDMKWSITGMFEMNMFGFPYVGADICGFFDNATEHLCVRWMQLGAFYPMSRNHNIRRTRDQDPASFSLGMVKTAREVLLMRYYLLPYLYSLFYLAHTRGSPVIRPLAFEFPLDEKALRVDEQFMWGPALLISPVLTNNTFEVNAYFPKGRWYDFLTGGEVGGTGDYIKLPTPLDQINLHLRGGQIITAQLPDVTTKKSRKNPVDLIVSLDENFEARGFGFFDDGDTMDTHLHRSQHRLSFYDATKNSVTIDTEDGEAYTMNVRLNSIIIFGLPKSPKLKSFYYAREDGETKIDKDAVKWDAEHKTLALIDLKLSLNEDLRVYWKS